MIGVDDDQLFMLTIYGDNKPIVSAKVKNIRPHNERLLIAEDERGTLVMYYYGINQLVVLKEI